MMHTILIVTIGLLAGSSANAQSAKVEYAQPGVDASRPVNTLDLDARLVEKGPAIERGVIWRVFEDEPAEVEKLRIVATARGGKASIPLNAGTYLVHAAFGRAGASKRVVVDKQNVTENFVLQAGGLNLDAETSEGPIPADDLRFSIYELEEGEDGERKMIAHNVSAGKIVQLNEGIYHVVSKYGDINVTVRADLEVKAGQVTRAVLLHRGAAVSMRLVSFSGGDPVANTAWSVFTKDGEQVFSSRSVAPSIVLAEGTYEAVVRHGDDNFRKNFIVESGKNVDLELLLR